MSDDFTILLLAGGKSRRFWPISSKLNLQFLGKTLLELQLDLILKQKFKQIIIVTQPLIKDLILPRNCQVILQKGDGQSAAILSAKDLILNKPLLILNADDLINATLLQKIKSVIKKDNNIIVGWQTEKYFPGGYLVMNNKQIAKIHEKPGAGNEPSSFVKLVYDYFSNSNTLLKYLESNKASDLESRYEAALTAMLNDGIAFELVEYQDKWIPIKYPWDTLKAMEYFFKQIKTTSISAKAHIHKTVSISGPVIIEDGVQVMEYSKLVGPLYLGKDVIIGNHCLLRQSHVSKNCVVGFCTEITRSYIGQDSWFHSNYVGDSVLGNKVSMGAGAVLSNLRLDEGDIYSTVGGERVNTLRNKLGAIIGDGTKISVAAQIMPGVKIGRNCVVGPGIILAEDLLDDKRCFINKTYKITDNKLTNFRNRDSFRNKIF